MNLKINSALKPLSANLKRLEMGFILFFKNFEHVLEENDLDTFWQEADKIHRKNKDIYTIEVDYEEQTEILIIALNEIFELHQLVPHGNYDVLFNSFVKAALVYFIENNKNEKDFSKILIVLNNLPIIKKNTILEVEEVIKKNAVDKNVNVFESDIIAERNNVQQSNKMNYIKKYQVFISSTYTDLKEERQAAVETILKKGHIPAGMELFTANDKSQWEVIKKWIDDSDIYLLIFGGRYGSLDSKTGVSYSEMEYNYAVQTNKPLFALILDDLIIDNKPREITKDYDLKNPKYLNFKKEVSKKMCSFPKNIDQIKLDINHSLDDLIAANYEEMLGWIKGNRI